MTHSIPVTALVASWSELHFSHFKSRVGINYHIGGIFETSNLCMALPAIDLDMLTRFLPFCLLLTFQSIAAVPTPESHFGHKMGVDNELLDWDKVVSYFKALPGSSNRIKYLELGKTPRRAARHRRRNLFGR